MVMMRGTNGLAQGLGNAKRSLAIVLFDGFVVRTGQGYLLETVNGMGIFGYFLGFALAAIATSLSGFCFFPPDFGNEGKAIHMHKIV
jgi:Na+-driven multidrug efflux pump